MAIELKMPALSPTMEEGTLTNEEIRDGMRKAARNHDLNTVPVFVTSGTANCILAASS